MAARRGLLRFTYRTYAPDFSRSTYRQYRIDFPIHGLLASSMCIISRRVSIPTAPRSPRLHCPTEFGSERRGNENFTEPCRQPESGELSLPWKRQPSILLSHPSSHARATAGECCTGNVGGTARNSRGTKGSVPRNSRTPGTEGHCLCRSGGICPSRAHGHLPRQQGPRSVSDARECRSGCQDSSRRRFRV